MNPLLQQKTIRSLLRKRKLRMSAVALCEYLKANHHRIDGLKLVHHSNVNKNGTSNNWYEIVSDLPQERANRLVVEQVWSDMSSS